jgi:hypothetical protein
MKLYKRPDSPTWQLAYRCPTTGERKRVSLNYQGSKQRALVVAEELVARTREEAHSARVHGASVSLAAPWGCISTSSTRLGK